MTRGAWLLVGLLAAGALFTIAPAELLTVPAAVQKLAYAIAIGERGQQEIGSGNVTRNNPGDITDNNGNLLSYDTLADGWADLYHQVSLMFSGGSRYYWPGMTIDQMAQTYDGTSKWNDLAANVAAVLGVSRSTRLVDIA